MHPFAAALDSRIVREYDVRGVVGKDFFPEGARAMAAAFGSRVRRAGGQVVCLGWDGRHSAPEFVAAAEAGLLASGVRVLKIGMGPSPMLYFAVKHLRADAGLMVTASHNPPEYNGMKMVHGTSLSGMALKELAEVAARGDFIAGEGQSESVPVEDAYVARLRQDYTSAQGLRVAWDPAHGAAGEVLQKLIKLLPGEHFVINASVDGSFPAHDPDPTVEENMQQLKELVRREKCDLGIGFDGDADRVGAVDGAGHMLAGDQLLAILAADVLREQPGATIIADVKASVAAFDEIKRLGGQPFMWKAGHSHIKNKMAELGAALAGEMSGHIFFAHKYYGFDDGLYSAVRLLDLLMRGGKSLAQLRAALPVMHSTPEYRLPVAEERKFAIVDEIKARAVKLPGVEVVDVDGVRVTNEKGWWLVRTSNTQAMVSVRVEAYTPAALAELVAVLADQLEQSGVPFSLEAKPHGH